MSSSPLTSKAPTKMPIKRRATASPADGPQYKRLKSASTTPQKVKSFDMASFGTPIRAALAQRIEEVLLSGDTQRTKLPEVMTVFDGVENPVAVIRSAREQFVEDMAGSQGSHPCTINREAIGDMKQAFVETRAVVQSLLEDDTVDGDKHAASLSTCAAMLQQFTSGETKLVAELGVQTSIILAMQDQVNVLLHHLAVAEVDRHNILVRYDDDLDRLARRDHQLDQVIADGEKLQATLDDHVDQINDAKNTINDQRVSLERYKKTFNDFQQEIDRMTDIINKLEHDHQRSLAQLEDDHQKSAGRREVVYQRHITRLTSEHSKSVSGLKEEYEQCISRLRGDHQQRTDDLMAQLTASEAKCEAVKAQLEAVQVKKTPRKRGSAKSVVAAEGRVTRSASARRNRDSGIGLVDEDEA